MSANAVFTVVASAGIGAILTGAATFDCVARGDALGAAICAVATGALLGVEACAVVADVLTRRLRAKEEQLEAFQAVARAFDLRQTLRAERQRGQDGRPN